jgi:hypothetical protein
MNITHIRDCDYDNNYVELLQQLSNSSINKRRVYIIYINIASKPSNISNTR